MEKCKKCGEVIDWTNPNINYAGHTCDPEKVSKIKKSNAFDASRKALQIVGVCYDTVHFNDGTQLSIEKTSINFPDLWAEFNRNVRHVTVSRQLWEKLLKDSQSE